MARPFLRRLAASAAAEHALAACARLDSASPRVLRVLTYHRVDEPEPFASQMAYLGARYVVVSLGRVLSALEGGPELPPRAVLLTFDDAYASFAEVAWPILRAHGHAAALFVPTAYPDRDEPRFWWDRLEQAFARAGGPAPLALSFGSFALSTPAERARTHAAVKARVKDAPHDEALALTDDVCAALGAPREPHEVLGWDALRALAREGVVLGAHSRTHPRLDRVSRARARAEIRESLRELAREVPEQPRVFAYPDGRFDDELVELARAEGVELAFTTRRGTNDLARCDRLRLRRIHADARDRLAVLRAKLVLSAARLETLTRVLVPPSPAERGHERANARTRRRARLVLRPLDAALTAPLLAPAPRRARLGRALAPRTPHAERVGQLVRLALDAAPLRARLERRLLRDEHLPFAARAGAPLAFGSGGTVFRLELGGRPHALKVYRRTLGLAPAALLAAARRYRARVRRLAAAFGACVLPARFLVLHAPLCGVPAVASLQPWLSGPLTDLLALEDEALLARLARHGLAPDFASFARRALEWHARGTFPDLVGRGNLVLAEDAGRARLQLLDFGIFDAADAPAPAAVSARIDVLARRLAGLIERMEQRELQLEVREALVE
jgi:peptidoglycan/xylan/chitin deacetylase (PgdA/CDA1 family)